MSEEWDISKNAPASYAFVVTPVDSADLDHTTRGLFIGSAGNLKATLQGGVTVTFSGLLAGAVYPFAVTKIFSGSTTASSIVGLR